ncbi:PQ-loop-domain-containing protein [Rhodofomes roseus]|uniref:PQ-loop-domain-containing protein n=1 Tax=Rhodofomes roseus TaxID=34475 RepID=A0ABQ8JZ00_9APHY|nr:PQ-loop-domain-containing protein [Rhodofomes roseus]KAH9829532.1 PQ-loop-domain-containing protein [Rhodofomes roseus]
MYTNAAAENALGTLGALCWTVQLVPQIWKSWRTKSTEGLSPWFVLLWGVAAGFMGVYAIVRDLNVPLVLQPQLFGSLCLAAWAQCLYYGTVRCPRAVCGALYVAALAALAGFQVGVVYAVRPAYERGEGRAVEAVGIVSSVTLSLALFPQYYEIYVHREVVGISVPFMAIDMLGGVLSDLSLAFKPPPFDAVAALSYSLVVFLDGLVLLAAAILNPLAKRRRKRAAAASLAAPAPRELASDPESLPRSPSAGRDAEAVTLSTRASLRSSSSRPSPGDADRDAEEG